jgi:TonB family protein
MQLKPGTLLQGGKYKIIRTFGQGGFGITYEAEQVLLRKIVAVKEFFMKDCCERNEATSRMTVGTGSQRALVERFRGKFIREAQMIAGMDHLHIVRVLDVFEENGTAYYVMDFLPGGSLADMVKKDGPLSEAKAEKYIRQVADALDYIHGQNTVHLDVKPSNILLNAKGEAVLIDFGISKHYDDSGDQTSSTPVGISKGYAPLEQGRDGDVSQFKPSTDIYALGATMYFLITGVVPPEASLVNEDGLTKPLGVSDKTWAAIIGAMQPRRKDRPQNINTFLTLIDDFPVSKGLMEDEERTVVKKPFTTNISNDTPSEQNKSTKTLSFIPRKAWFWALIACVFAIVTAVLLFIPRKVTKVVIPAHDTLSVESQNVVEQTISTQQTVLATESETHRQSESPGSIKVESEPAGASVLLDGKNTKKHSPCILEGVSPGKHTIQLLLDGHNENHGSISVAPGKRVVFSRTLTPQITDYPLTEFQYKEVVEEEVEEYETYPFQLVERRPSFNGGDANEFSKWVNSQLVYPEIAKKNGVQGRVTLQFTVDIDGRVTNVKVLNSVDEYLDKEAVRVVSSSPRWEPGYQRDRIVRVTYTFPVIFELK